MACTRAMPSTSPPKCMAAGTQFEGARLELLLRKLRFLIGTYLPKLRNHRDAPLLRAKRTSIAPSGHVGFRPEPISPKDTNGMRRVCASFPIPTKPLATVLRPVGAAVRFDKALCRGNRGALADPVYGWAGKTQDQALARAILTVCRRPSHGSRARQVCCCTNVAMAEISSLNGRQFRWVRGTLHACVPQRRASDARVHAGISVY